MIVYKETAYIKLASFLYREEFNQLPLKKDGQVDMSGFYEVTRLDDAEAKSVMDVLVNYDFSAPDIIPADSAALLHEDVQEVIEKIEKDELSCYEPRNAILFFNKKNEIIGFVELCFDCLRARRYPQALRVGEFCNEKFAVVQQIFSRNAIRYGVPEVYVWSRLDSLKRRASSGLWAGRMYLERGKLPEATRKLTNAIGLDSGSRYAYFYLGHIHFMMKRYEKARLNYDKVINLDPGFRQAYYERALAAIEISKNLPDKKISTAICNDLTMVQKLGDESVSKLKAKYCGR